MLRFRESICQDSIQGSRFGDLKCGFMRRFLGIGAVVLGVAGVLVCATAIGIGWWTAVRTSNRIVRLGTRLDDGLSKADERLARVELRMNAIRTDLTKVREAAETFDSETQDLPRVRAAIEQVLDRLIPILDRADATADSLRSVAVGLRTGADIVDQLNDNLEATARARDAADKIDFAAESLIGLRARIDTMKSAKAVQLTRELVTLAQEAVAGSERLAEGLTAARQEIAVVRERATDRRNNIIFSFYVAATANTLLWLWSGVGQLCLIGWGTGRCGRSPTEPHKPTEGLSASK